MASVGLIKLRIIARASPGHHPAAAGTYSAVAYVANFNAGNVTAVNVNADATLATITVGTHPTGVAFSPDGKKVYVANQGSNSVSVIGTATNTVTDTIPWDRPLGYRDQSGWHQGLRLQQRGRRP